MKNLALFGISLIALSAQASNCSDFNLSGTYQCNGFKVAVLQKGQNFDVTVGNFRDVVFADGRSREAGFMDYGKPAYYSAQCFGSLAEMRYKILGSQERFIRQVQLRAVENDITVYYDTGSSNRSQRCNRTAH